MISYTSCYIKRRIAVYIGLLFRRCYYFYYYNYHHHHYYYSGVGTTNGVIIMHYVDESMSGWGVEEATLMDAPRRKVAKWDGKKKVRKIPVGSENKPSNGGVYKTHGTSNSIGVKDNECVEPAGDGGVVDECRRRRYPETTAAVYHHVRRRWRSPWPKREYNDNNYNNIYGVIIFSFPPPQ